MKKIIIILSLILLAGVFFRFYQLGRQSYWMDEGYTINAVISAAHNGYANGSSILDSGGKYFCPLYCFPTQIISQVAGQNAFSYRLLAVIFGLIFIVLAFYLTKIFFKSNKAALLAAFLVSFSYWQIAWSRQARWYTMLEVFFWLALLFFYLFLKSPLLPKEGSGGGSCHCERLAKQSRVSYILKNRYTSLALSFIFTILAIITHRLAYLLPIIMLGWYIIHNWDEIKKLVRFFKISWWLNFIVKIKSQSKPDLLESPAQPTLPIPNHYRQRIISALLKIFIPIAITAAVILFAEFGLGLHFIAHALQHISFHYTLPYYLSFYLRNYWMLLELVIYGYLSASQEQKKPMLMLSLPFLLYLIGLSFFSDIVHYRYLFHTTLFLYVLTAITAIDILAKIKQNYWKIISLVLLIILFFVSGEGVFLPKNSYLLESDNPDQFRRPYYAYTPQPDFNDAYDVINQNLKPGEIVISSHPHFNKIFLNQPGYWLSYDYLGMDNTPDTVINNKEYYVGAETINTLRELQKLVANKHGYVVFDYMSTDGRISPLIINYIRGNFKEIYYNKVNSYSQIWVYHF